METEVCSSAPRIRLSSARTLLPFEDESYDEELSVLPRHTKVVVTGNNRTKSVLVGLQGVVKKAVGFGGWHWLVLKNGVEVKLQRNALSVLEPPTGNEDEDDAIDYYENAFSSSSDMGDKDMEYTGLEFRKLTKPRVRNTRSWSSSSKFSDQTNSDNRSSNYQHEMRVNLTKLGSATLWRYWKHFNLVSINPNPTQEQLIDGVQHHFLSQQVDEVQVIYGFAETAKRLKTSYS